MEERGGKEEGEVFPAVNLNVSSITRKDFFVTALLIRRRIESGI